MRSKGFTLAELLIALAILGVIATFTIPKVLQGTTSGQNTSIAREAYSTVSGAFSAYQLTNSIAATVGPADLTSLINYVRTDTSTNLGAGSVNCGAGGGFVCLVMHNGGYLAYDQDQTFGTTAATQYINFSVDPDADGVGATDATIAIYVNGRLTTGQYATGAQTGGITVELTDPAYVDW